MESIALRYHPPVVKRICFILASILTLSIPLHAGLMLSPPLPLGELRYGGAWNLQDFPTATWTGEHFLTTWIEHQGSPANRNVVKAARFTEQGDRIDPFGIEILAGADIRYARILDFEDSKMLLWADSDGIHSALLNDQFQISRRESILTTQPLLSFDAAVLGDRALVSWENEYALEPSVALISDEGFVLGGAVPLLEAGSHASVAAAVDEFLVVYINGGYGNLGVDGRLVTMDGTIGPPFEIVPRGDAVSSPSVAFTGEHFLVSYSARFRNDGLRLRTVSTEGEIGPETSIWSGHDTTRISCNDQDCLVVSTYIPHPCRITCVEGVKIAAALVTHDGELIEGGFGSHEVYRNTWPDLASSPSRHLVTWQHSPGWRDDRGRGVFFDEDGMSEDFGLSLSASMQRSPVSAGDDDHRMIVWTESKDETFNRCLRGSLWSSGSEPVVLDVAPCRTFQDIGGGSSEGYYSLSWDGNTWLLTWSEQVAGGKVEIRGRIISPGGTLGEPFVIATAPFATDPFWLSTGGESGHLIVRPNISHLVASRISSTGIIVEDSVPVLWPDSSSGFGIGRPINLTSRADGFILSWEQTCSGSNPPGDSQNCGLHYRKLDLTGRTVGVPERIGGRAEDASIASSGLRTLVAWTEAVKVDQPAYEWHVRVAVTDDQWRVSPAQTIDTIRVKVYDQKPTLRAAPHGNGFLLAIIHDDVELSRTTLIKLDADGRPVGDSTTIDGVIRDIFDYGGKTAVIQEIYKPHAPWYGVPRLFLRTLEERLPRHRSIRR